MAFNGSGTFVRVHNWVTDRDASIPITASRMDAEHDGFATGLSNCITKDGQTTVTANLPMATYRHTGVGNAASRDNYAAAGQIQDDSLKYVVDTGAADAYVMTLVPAITAYATGAKYRFIAANSNTGASTLNVNAVAATAITKNGGTALASGDIVAGDVVEVVYDGTNFEIVGLRRDLQATNVALTAIAGLSTTDGNIIVGDGSSWVAESGSTARASLGAVGTTHTGNVSITGDLTSLTSLTVDNIVTNGNDIYASSGNLTLNAGGAGSTSLYYAGAQTLQSAIDGVNIYDSSGTEPFLNLYSSTGTLQGYLKSTSTGVNLRNLVHGAVVSLSAEDTVGTNQNILVGDPDGAATIYYNGTAAITTSSDGALLYSTVDNDPTLRFYQDDLLTQNAWIEANATGGLELRSLVHGANVTISAEDVGGSAQNMFRADPDGAATLYYAGSTKFITTNAGGSFYGSSSNDPASGLAQTAEIQILNSSGSLAANWRFNASTQLDIINRVHGGSIALQAENSGGALTSLLAANPGGALTGYYTGIAAFASDAQGLRIYDTSGNDPTILLYQDNLSTRNGYIQAAASGGLIVQNEIHGGPVILRGEDGSGTVRVLVHGDPTGQVNLYYIGSSMARTVAAASGGFEINNQETAAGFERALTESDRPQEKTVSASRNFATSDCGHTVYSTSASDTYTMVSSIGWDGAMIQFVTDGNAATIAATGVTLTWKQGGSSSTGSRTIAAHSVCTLYRDSSTSWFIWGNGIS